MATITTVPLSAVRIAAARTPVHDSAPDFAAGANSIFYGDRLLTTSNPQAARDMALFERLGLRVLP